jgi:gliding motility-associated-like protein
MKQITNISIFLLMLISSIAYGQIQLGRQVIGSTGGFAAGSNFTVSSTVGEAVIQTLFSTNTILTQGFQQTLKPNDSIVDFEVINESCVGAKNGSIYIDSVLGCPGPYNVIIKSVDDTSTILGSDTLGTGDYEVVIFGNNGCSYSIIIFVGLDSDEDCVLKFYSGITPNYDGVNDSWWIDNIELFPENTVQIYNRWGNEVWYGEGYNNDDVVWVGKTDEGKEMPDATYFYIAKVAGKRYKGWIELTR